MAPVTFRRTLLTAHIVSACLLGTYLYAPTLGASEGFRALVAFGAFPVMRLTGLAMKYQGKVMRALGLNRRTQA